jgi:hypothetical protein
MARPIEAAAAAELVKEAVRLALFVRLDFDSATTRLWSGTGSVTWDDGTGSASWTGLGNLGKLSPVEETSDGSARGMTFELTGIPPENLALALDEPYQSRRAHVWLAFLDASDAVLDDPVKLFSGRLDVMDIDDTPGAAAVRITAESALLDFDRAIERRWTDGDQRSDFSGDAGLSFAAALANKELRWLS